jgi:CubicO group peptidase (beta-lactamase class C family)
MGGHVLRTARHRRLLAQGVARSSPARAGPQGRSAAVAGARDVLGIQRRPINQLALALLHVFRRPLPDVFRAEVLGPLGGGKGFAWEGYDDAWIDLPGVGRVPSVPGGSHWGAGVSISARDQARIGQMMLAGGTVGGRRIVAAEWLERMVTPSAVAPFYGRLLWLNRSGNAFPGASPRAFVMQGAGGHYVWVDPDFDSVVVLRWIDTSDASAAIERIAAALGRPA